VPIAHCRGQGLIPRDLWQNGSGPGIFVWFPFFWGGGVSFDNSLNSIDCVVSNGRILNE
jgi:hypothetical protein